MDKQNFTRHREQVLLFGNGLIRNKEWGDVIHDMKDERVKCDFTDTNIPYPLQSSALLCSDDKERRNRYDDYFTERKGTCAYSYKKSYPFVERIADMDFDAYLTTNYTYELEQVLCPGYLEASRKLRYAKSTKERKDSCRIKYTYNSFMRNEKEKKIWHIHGEARNKSSLIFTHNDYGRLLGNLTEINRKAGNKYDCDINTFEVESWFDYFITADMYILGFGLDWSEIDIWWLLCRRVRERSGHGKIFFFDPKNEQARGKYELLQALDVQHIDFGMNVSDEDGFYDKFYDAALEKINSLMKESGK